MGSQCARHPAGASRNRRGARLLSLFYLLLWRRERRCHRVMAVCPKDQLNKHLSSPQRSAPVLLSLLLHVCIRGWAGGGVEVMRGWTQDNWAECSTGGFMTWPEIESRMAKARRKESTRRDRTNSENQRKYGRKIKVEIICEVAHRCCLHHFVNLHYCHLSDITSNTVSVNCYCALIYLIGRFQPIRFA